jgi:hypothetical protein
LTTDKLCQHLLIQDTTVDISFQYYKLCHHVLIQDTTVNISFQYHNITTNNIISISAVESTLNTPDVTPSSVNTVPSNMVTCVWHITLETFTSSHSLSNTHVIIQEIVSQ